MKQRVLAFGLACFLFATAQVHADEPGWYGRPILFGQERSHMQSLHILDRPYRPFHFYGNTVRRQYYRGWGLPLPRDLVCGAVSLIRDF